MIKGIDIDAVSVDIDVSLDRYVIPDVQTTKVGNK